MNSQFNWKKIKTNQISHASTIGRLTIPASNSPNFKVRNWVRVPRQVVRRARPPSGMIRVRVIWKASLGATAWPRSTANAAVTREHWKKWTRKLVKAESVIVKATLELAVESSSIELLLTALCTIQNKITFNSALSPRNRNRRGFFECNWKATLMR